MSVVRFVALCSSDAADRMEELGTFLAIELANKHLQPHVILGQSRKLARLTGMSALPSILLQKAFLGGDRNFSGVRLRTMPALPQPTDIADHEHEVRKSAMGEQVAVAV